MHTVSAACTQEGRRGTLCRQSPIFSSSGVCVRARVCKRIGLTRERRREGRKAKNERIRKTSHWKTFVGQAREQSKKRSSPSSSSGPLSCEESHTLFISWHFFSFVFFMGVFFVLFCKYDPVSTQLR